MRPVSITALARQGRATELPGIGAIIQEKVLALADDGVIPAAVKLRAKFPAGLIEMTRLPGLGPKRARRLFEELGIDSLDALTPPPSSTRSATLKGFGPKAEESILAAAERRRRRRAPRRADRARPRARGRRAAGRRAARASRLRSRRARRLGAADDRQRQGPRRDRDRDGPARAGDGRSRPRADRGGRHAERGRRPDADPHRPSGRPARSSRPTSSATCSSTSPAPRSTTWRCATPPCARACTCPSTACSTTPPARPIAARPRPRSTRCSGSSTSSPSCARTAASSRPPRRGTLPELIELSRPARRPALPHDRVGRDRLDRGDGDRRRATPATSTWRSPTTRRASASATISAPIGCASTSTQIRATSRRGDRAARRQRGQHPPGRHRSITTTRCSPSSIGSSRASTHRSGWRSDAMTERMIRAIEHPLVDVLGHPSGRKIEKRRRTRSTSRR